MNDRAVIDVPPRIATPGPNAVVIAAWNSVLFDKFLRFKHLLTEGLAVHSEEAFLRHPYPEAACVLDVGCGFGDTTRRIARRVGPRGAAWGVDCAANFVAASRREAARAKVVNASYFEADAQYDDLRGPYDFAFSRFGTMFFSQPAVALRNIRKALRPGGELTMVVWRRREDNPWLHEAELRVRQLVPVVAREDSDQVHCGPGPFSMAGADTVSAILRGSGYDRIVFERFDADICIGRDLGDAVDFAMALGPAGEIMRLAGAAGAARQGVVRAALVDTLSPYVRRDGIWAPSSTWIVTACNPR